MSPRPAAQKIKTWRHNPVQFVRECLKAEPDEWQADGLIAIRDNQRVAFKASKGPGKSTLMAWALWWFLTTRLHPKIVATSISGDNLRDGLWTEAAKWMNNSGLLKDLFGWSAERIANKQNPETWWASARQWSKTADTTQQANTLAGVHAKSLMFLLDEAGGIPMGVAAAAEAGLTSGDDTKLIMSGNPTHLEGPLYNACTRERALWKVIEISGDPDDPKRAPRVSIKWAREQIEKYGKDSPYVLVNVYGKFPPTSTNALLGIEEVTAAAKRGLARADYYYSPKILGVDVARFGDDRTVLFPRQGLLGMPPKVFRNLDTMEVAGQVALAIETWHPDGVFVDQTGIGAGVVDRLRQLGHDVTGVDFGGKSLIAEPKLLNRRAEMWWNMAQWIKNGGAIPNEPELISELVAPTYRFDASGRLVLESKAELKGRGLPSPDLADALGLTFAYPVQARVLGMPMQSGHHALTEYDPYNR